MICPVLTKLDVGGEDTSSITDSGSGTIRRHSVICTCNQNGTFTYEEDGVPTSYDCELWDYTNGRCGLKVTELIKEPSTEEDNLMIMLEKIIGKTSEKASAEGTGSSLLRELNHMHGAHWHPSQHTCPQIPVNCGQPTSGGASFGTPFATVLIAEFMSNQDLDSNGYIYGKDFMIEDSYDKPIMIKSIEQTPEWEDPSITIAWTDMLAWSLDPVNAPNPLP